MSCAVNQNRAHARLEFFQFGPVSRESLRAQAAVQRSAVAEAVASALGKRAADAPAADTDAGGGKRAAVAAAMDPLLGLLGGSDDEEDEEKEGWE